MILGAQKTHKQFCHEIWLKFQKSSLFLLSSKITETRFTTIQSSFVRMPPTYRARTRPFFAFSPFSRPESLMTIIRRVFVAIMEGKLGFGLVLRLS